VPYKETEADDPMELVGVVLPAEADAVRDMAYAFAEEFARMGYERAHLLSLFQNPFYAGAHGAYRALGDTEILTIIDECLNVWGRSKITVQEVSAAQNVPDELNDLNDLNLLREEGDDG